MVWWVEKTLGLRMPHGAISAVGVKRSRPPDNLRGFASSGRASA